jgi:hypothetical protein
VATAQGGPSARHCGEPAKRRQARRLP